jgi:hypothetical protein
MPYTRVVGVFESRPIAGTEAFAIVLVRHLGVRLVTRPPTEVVSAITNSLILPSEYGWAPVSLGSTVVLVVVATFGVAGMSF